MSKRLASTASTNTDALDAAGYFYDEDDIVFKSCMVQSQYCAFALQDTVAQAAPDDAKCSLPPTATFKKYIFEDEDWRSDSSAPSRQPGAGIYTSPLTVNVEARLEDVASCIEGMLCACQMPFSQEKTKFKVSLFFFCLNNFCVIVIVFPNAPI